MRDSFFPSVLSTDAHALDFRYRCLKGVSRRGKQKQMCVLFGAKMAQIAQEQVVLVCQGMPWRNGPNVEWRPSDRNKGLKHHSQALSQLIPPLAQPLIRKGYRYLDTICSTPPFHSYKMLNHRWPPWRPSYQHVLLSKRSVPSTLVPSRNQQKGVL